MTIRNRVDQIMPASDELYRGLFEHMLEGLAYCKMIYEAGEPSDFIYLDVNSAFEQLTGLTGVCGKPVSEVIPGIRESNPELFEIYGRVAATGKPEKLETYVDGLGIWFAISVYSPRPEHFVAVFQNITERKQIEETLAKEQYLLQALLDAAPDYIYFKDTASRFIRTSKSHAKAFGLSDPAQVIGKSDFDFFTEEHARQAYADEQEIIRTRRPISKEEKETWADRADSWVLTTKIPLCDQQGNIIGTFGLSKDISERKQAEARITDLLSFNEKVLNTAPVGILIYKSTGQCLFANENAARIVGTTIERLLTQNFRSLESWKKSGLYRLASTIASEEPVMADIHHTTTFGNDKWLTASAATFQSKAETQLLLAFSDITERKRAEETLKDSEERFRTFVEQSNDGVTLVDETGKVVEWNQAQADITGIPRPNAIGSLIWEIQCRLLLPEYHANGTMEFLRTSMQTALATGQSPQFAKPHEIEIFTLTEERKTITQSSFPIKTDKGYRLGSLAHDISDRKQAEEAQLKYTTFLESLNSITRIVVEAQDLESTLKSLVENIAKLFGADDAFFSFWDEEQKLTIPMIAYGSTSEIFPTLQFEPGERTLAAAVMETERPLAVPEVKSSPYINPKFAAIVPSRSILGIPLIAQGKKLAAFYLGYNSLRHFDQNEITYAQSVAQQIALVLMKIRLLEDAQRQVRQLSVLHKVASIATQVSTIDQLLERTTEVIGRNLFPDNFGVLLMDEDQGVLHPHPSYQFTSGQNSFLVDIPIGQGITGKVAETGQPICIGTIEGIQNYVDIDKSTVSELCVPIKLKDRVLGVINAESSRKYAFTLDDKLLLGTLAGQLATAMEQIRTSEAERQWMDQLAHSNALIYAIAQMTTQIERELTQKEIIPTLGRELRKLDLTCTLATFDKERGKFTITYASMELPILEQMENGIGFSLVGSCFSIQKLNSILYHQDILRPAVITSPENEIQVLFPRRRDKDITEILLGVGVGPETELLRLPLVFEENLLGILWVWGKAITKNDLPIMSIFAKQIGSSLERARLFQEVQSLALTDPLTGLQNRRSLFELGRVELARSYRAFRPFSCLMLDIDHFKQLNDTYGHPIGDQVLQQLAECAKGSIREVDLIGRYGGEEFLIFLPETDLVTAQHVAERLRASIEKMPIGVLEQELHVTVSIGVSRKDENTLELETLIARADQALYVAKHKGRNQVASSK